MKNINWKNLWLNVRLMLILVGLLSLYSFTLSRNEARKLRRTQVEFIGNQDRFISEEAVNKLLIENKTAPQSIAKVQVDLNKLETAVGSNPMVSKAQVSVSIDGELKAVVRQKEPVVRVMSGDRSYYIDYEGGEMPLSDIYTARVPVVTWSGDVKVDKRLIKAFRHIHDDDFLRKEIIGIELLKSGGMVMKVRSFDYIIEFGKPINIERKFNNYKAFYQKAVNDSLISGYKRVNLKFTQQVICTK